MAIQQRLYDVDELWELYSLPENDLKRYELIEGVLIEISGPGGIHGRMVIRLGRFLDTFAEENNLGIVTAETGCHPPDDRHTLLLPDVAFISHGRAPDPFPANFIPVMPDLVVEIQSPSNTIRELREKAQLYLRLGVALVWLVSPATGTVEIHRAGRPLRTLARTDSLSGEDILPGFALSLPRLFA